MGGRPDAPRDCREHGLATAKMIDVSLRVRIVYLIPETGSYRLNRKRDGSQLSPVAAVLALTAREEASSLVLVPRSVGGCPPCGTTTPTEAACICREDVLVILRNDGLAVPMLKLGLPPLELLNHPRVK